MNMLPTPFQFSTAPTRNVPFETQPHSIHTIPLLRAHPDAYLYYIRCKTYEIAPSQKRFRVIFVPVESVNTGIYYTTIYPQNIQLTIPDIFNNYMNKLIEFNESLDTPIYRPSILEDLQQEHLHFEVPDIDSQIN